jgi:hypothetical protein
MTCKFSVSGKKGKFLEKQVTPESLAKADAATAAGAADGRALDSASLNKGAFAGTGLDMPATERALNAMLARIAASWPHRPPMPVSVRVVGKSDYSPVAKPDGVIVVPLGLLVRARSDDEVGWVLAHEYGHIALAHFSREAKQRRAKAKLETVIACTRTGFELAQHRVSSSGGQLRFTRVENKGLTALSSQVWAKGELVGTIMEAYNQSLSRDQEDEADVAGLDLVLRAGRSEAGYGTALDAVAADEKRHGTLIEQFGRDMERYTKLAAVNAVGQAVQGADGGDIAKSFINGLLRNFVASAIGKLVDMVTASHRPADKRKEGLAKYMDAAWADATPPEPQTTWLAAVRATPEFKEAEIAVNARDSALQELITGPIDPNDPAQVAKVYAAATSAYGKIVPATATRYARTPLIANAMARIDMAVQNYNGADELYDIADRSPQQAPAARAQPARGKRKGSAPVPAPAPQRPPDPYLQQSLEGFRDHVALLVVMRNYRKALAVVDLAKSRFQDDQAFLPSLIAIYAAANRTPELLDAITRCAKVQDEALSDSCDLALLDPAQQQKLAMLSPDEHAKFVSRLSSLAADARRGTTCGIGGKGKPI